MQQLSGPALAWSVRLLLEATAGGTAGLLLLLLPAPDLGCGRRSIAQRRASSLCVSCVLRVSNKHSAAPLQLSAVSVPVSCFSSLHFWHCSSVAAASRTTSASALTGTFCCPSLPVKPAALTTSLIVLGPSSWLLTVSVSVSTLLLGLQLTNIGDCICF